jgi:hypothetical protein
MCRLKGPLLVVLVSTFAVVSSANQHAVAQFGGKRNDDEQVAANQPSERPKAMIALTIWILKLSESHDEVDPELAARIAERVDNLSPVVGSVSEVRELVGRMRVAGLLSSERELRMVTLDGQPVSAQIGRHEPRIVATSSDPRQGQMNSIKFEEMGVLIKALPQIDTEEFIQVSVEIGESDSEKSTDVPLAVPAEGTPYFADVVTTRQFNTTARTKSGSAVLVQSDAPVDSEDAAANKTQLIILGAAIVDAPE